MMRKFLPALTMVLLAFGLGGIFAVLRIFQRRSQTLRLAVSPPASLCLRIERRGKTAPVCCVRASQTHFLLSRAQVRLFYRLLIEAKSTLWQHTQGSSSPCWEEDPRCTESALQEQICFVSRPVHLQFPAILTVTALSLEITPDELETLEIQVMFLSQDLDTYDATWFLAQAVGQRVSHLVRKVHCVKNGPVLCGCLPPASLERAKGWVFFPVIGPLETDHLCPTCWQQWEKEPQPFSVPSVEQGSFRQGQPCEEGWYDR